ncbi:hypothetical protein TNCV_1093881 [Trichonephila clavipes]|uniref:Uncharacterized protein n=1 Tax=Trichonephila clavipes TaxID=2585209 RepID=A0A8X6UZC6_TRICX|nr:hypothetical protein TNCV_1093881 [Trichonephila clavipes]
MKTQSVEDRGINRVKHPWLEAPPPYLVDKIIISHGKIVVVEMGGVTIYCPFGESCRANSYCQLYGGQGLGVLLAPCLDEFRRPRSDYVRHVALSTTTHTDLSYQK